MEDDTALVPCWAERNQEGI